MIPTPSLIFYRVDMSQRRKNIALSSTVRHVLRKEFSDFFVEMLREEPRWPSISNSEFIDALADSLIEMSGRSGLRGMTLLQTLVYELQDRVNGSSSA
jgi:hypothetical protein